jgi:hypothetical protein
MPGVGHTKLPRKIKGGVVLSRLDPEQNVAPSHRELQIHWRHSKD